ncbi:Cold-regulated 413 inner membrane protein 2, chloroplastic [Heracleum sosnowskyi]|uniref:Cold-regulated 413 inner membrane protein 2, chloroplastic n=1 Tax=Heracleum sosnowskyi TaxID=360622 RepID=A0AAD8MMR4_9APIA|nr:Cold-regulated 413 inner membrane protein 2, chloroplastic [Heracleum sosnowskyi]
MALSLSTSPTFSLYTHPNLLSLKSQPQRHLLLSPPPSLLSDYLQLICYSGGGAALFSPRNLQWIGTIASAVLMVAKGTPIQKSFIVPIFALQAPAAIVSWIKGEYGVWTVFLALLIRLFFFIPGELELPFIALLVVLVAPNQVMNLRGKQEGVILSLAIAAYLLSSIFYEQAAYRRHLIKVP